MISKSNQQILRSYYKPWVIRPLNLAILLVITIALIILTEYACHILPTANSKGIIDGLLNGTTFNKRQNYADNYTSTTIVTKYVASHAGVSIHPKILG